MRKIFRMMMLAAGIAFVSPVFAGGILTNTNQSAAFARMLARNATLEIDGVYYNPAGLVFLDKGWHFSVNNQAAFQTRTITNSLSTLNSHSYEGEAKSWIIPSGHVAYRTGKFAFSFGFGVTGGGGSVTFDNGLPSFEAPVSLLKRQITATTPYRTTMYSVNQYLKGSSATYGGQLGVSYKINEMFSASAGARIVMATAAYNGYIRSIQVNSIYTSNPTGAMTSASTFFTNINQPTLAAATADKSVDVNQRGFGVTPILGVNFCYEKLVVAARYEFNTKMNLKNDTKEDDTGMFPDGAETPADIPAILSMGAAYDIFPSIKLSLGYNHYFDPQADMEKGKQQYIEHGGNEYLAGAEWSFLKRFLVSGGFQYTDNGVTANYQSDMAHSFDSYSVGMGGAIKFAKKFRVNVGYFFTKYKSNSKQITYGQGMPWQETAIETYDRTNNVFSIGLDFRF